MTAPQTLLQMSGANLQPAALRTASLILIDFQNEYLSGSLELTGAIEAIAKARQLISAAREAGTHVVHVAHKGGAGGLFDRSADRGQIILDVKPEADEQIIEKSLPNSFAETPLHSVLQGAGRKEIIICGFMTHMCVSSTARAALDLGYRVTIDAESCATRDLPSGHGGIISATNLHNASLAALSDRFAVIARNFYSQ